MGEVVIMQNEDLSFHDLFLIGKAVDEEMKNADPIVIGEYDFYEYPRDETKLSDDVFNFYDSDLEGFLKRSLQSKELEYRHKSKKLDDEKLFLYMLIKKEIEEENADDPRLDDLIKMHWWWIWKVWGSKEIEYLNNLDWQIINLRSALKYAKRLKPGYKPKYKAGGYTEADIELADAVSVVELIGGKHRQTGGKVIINCPFHTETRGSFVIYPDNSWHCFGCAKHGNGAIDFVMQKDKIRFYEAVGSLVK